MKVRIKVPPTGLINGKPWPPAGSVIELPDIVAAGMLATGFVVEERPAPAGQVETRESKAEGSAAEKAAPKNTSARSGSARTRKERS